MRLNWTAYGLFLLGTIATMVAVFATPAIAHNPSRDNHPARVQRFDGVLVVSGASGGRDVVESMIVGRGVFNGKGRIVERHNRPGEGDDISRDDLVFKAGTLHIVNTNLSFDASVDPVTCVFSAHIAQRTATDGGTGLFRHARGTFDATVSAHAIGQKAADGSCDHQTAPLFETDVVSATGKLKL